MVREAFLTAGTEFQQSLYMAILSVCVSVTTFLAADVSLKDSICKKVDNILLKGALTVHLMLGFPKQKGSWGEVLEGFWSDP